jgi:SAM-dependent methyltransferase
VLASGSIPVREVLELGSGGGNNAAHLKATFTMTLIDLSEEMLEVSRRLNPECDHHRGDMRTARLGRSFDAIFVHDAVDYMTTRDDLRRAIETAFVHCRPGGIAVFVPDHTRESFEETTDHGGNDGDDGRGVRYVEWTWIRILATPQRGLSTRSCSVTSMVPSGSCTRLIVWACSALRTGFDY